MRQLIYPVKLQALYNRYQRLMSEPGRAEEGV